MSRWIAGLIVVASIVVTESMFASPARAQDAAQQANAAQPSAQEATAAQLGVAAQAPQPAGHNSRLEASADWIQNKFGGSGQAKDGFYPEFNGLPPGSGITAGRGFRQRFFDGRALVSASGAYSVSRGKFGQATFELPRLADDHVSVGAQAGHGSVSIPYVP